MPDIDLESLPMPRNVDPLDVEAAARMIRSENPRAPDAAKVEQIWTQLRARRRGQSLYARITGGHGYGSQGASRPVSTDAEATDADRELAARVLRGELPSALPDARKFFDPDEQDRAFRQVTKAKAALAAGQPITANDRRLLNAGYKRDAAAVREKWSSEGSRYVDVIGPVEFWT